MYLKSIGAKNFLGYRSLKLKVRPGLTLIDGINHHFAAGSSGCSGKSTLEEVIGYGSFGRTIRNIPKDKVIHHGKSYARVWNDYVQDDGKLLRVIHYREHPKYGNSARLLLDNKDSLSGRTVNDSNRRISRRLGFDFDLFKRSIVIHSRMTDSFVDVDDKYLKQITEKLIGMPDFDPLLKRVKNKTDDIYSSIEAAVNGIENQRELIEEKKQSLKKYHEQYEKFEQRQKKRQRGLDTEIKEHKVALQTAKSKIKKLTKLVDDYATKLGRMRDKSKLLDISEAKATSKAIHYGEEVAKKVVRKEQIIEIGNRYRKLGGSICPECKQKVSKKHIKDKINENAKEFEELVTWTALAEVTKSRNLKAEQEARQLSTDMMDAIGNARERFIQYRSEKEHCEALEKQHRKQLRRLQERSEEKNPYRKLIDEAVEYIRKREKRLVDLKVKVSKRKKRLLYYEFWKRGFGPSGIRSYILDAVNPVLNRIANIYLSFLMEGNMTVSLRTVRQKKDGSYSDRFEVEITNESGADSLDGSGDNELHSVDFALNLAMSDVLESRIPGGFGFMFIDQALDLFDTVRGGKAVQLLKQKLNKKWCEQNQVPHKRSIWVITHKEQLKGLFENKIMVEKRGGVCRVLEQ